MNTIGKILVIVVFLLSLGVGAFLVVDFATRTNWKTAFESMKRDAEVYKASREVAAQTAEKALNDYKAAQLELEKQKQKLAEQETEAKAHEATAQLQLTEAQQKAKDADLSLQRALSDVERLKVSVTDLNKIIKEREEFVLALQQDVKKYRAEAVANESLAKALTTRNEQLLTDLQSANQRLAQKEAGSTTTNGSGPATTDSGIRTGAEPNPPTTMVKGQVEKIDPANPNLVQLNVGTDQGVNKGNTMEIYRMRPEAKYLGVVRIVEAYHNKSVGRLVATPGATTRPQLKEGDQVASWLSK